MKFNFHDAQGRTMSGSNVLAASYGLVALMLAAIPIGNVSAREPTQMDIAFCNHYAEVMQTALEVDRSGDPRAIAQFRQSVSQDPQAYLIVRGLGISQTTPPWIADVTVQSRQQCLDEVRFDRRGSLPNDPERANSISPGNYVVRMPTPTAETAREEDDLLKQWWVAQDACRGRPDESVCDKRDHLTAALKARGYELRSHDVWTTGTDSAYFHRFVVATSSPAGSGNTSKQQKDDPAALRSLRERLSDEKIIAIWNDRQQSLRERYPLAWPALERQIKQVVAEHAHEKNDVRYMLDY